MAEAATTTIAPRRFGQTMRPDVWWTQPLLIFLGLASFIVYSTWAAFQGNHYYFGPYLSPFYSPELFGDSPHSWFGPKPAFWPDPPACTVGEPRKSYLGERSFPLIMQNVHRYFLYFALLFIIVLTID